MSQKKAKAIAISGFILFFALGLRVFFLSTPSFPAFRETVKEQQQKRLEVKKIRGQITDRNGIPFTDRLTSEISLCTDGELKAAGEDAKFSFNINRRSPQTAAHVTGYTAADGSGISGLEQKFDYLLRDKGSVAVEYMADARGKPLDGFSLKETSAENMSEVRLCLDYHIQKAAEQVMDKYIKKGAAVIIDTESFEVLAMVSRPSFDGENTGKYKGSKNGELLNRVLLPYNAGSVFKIITAAAALEKSSAYNDRYFNCLGNFALDEKTVFACHKNDGHGMLDFSDAFAASCNCAYYILGTELGGESIISTARLFGMGERLLDNMADESSGNLPQKNGYTPGDCLNLAIGQGEILITPLQCAVMAATVANDGIKKGVSLVSEITGNGEVKGLKNIKETQVIKKETALAIKNMMRTCVLSGTAKAAKDSGAMLAGKTGSAETGWSVDGKTLVHGWFCGFFPFDKPKYAMAILSEGGESGAESCVAPFTEIAEKINEIYPYKQ